MRMEMGESTRLICALLAMDHSSFCYKSCSECESPIPEILSHPFCSNCNGSLEPFKRLFRLLFSIATDTRVITVMCLERDAKIIFGCSAQQFFDFATRHPGAAKNASMVLEGELFQITLTKLKGDKAEHLQMTSVVPLRSGFEPVIQTLEELYRVQDADKTD
ncbi:hypothetical protein DITRI_Ditri16bG0099100 [Diplodiscus trichospermus]